MKCAARLSQLVLSVEAHGHQQIRTCVDTAEIIDVVASVADVARQPDVIAERLDDGRRRMGGIVHRKGLAAAQESHRNDEQPFRLHVSPLQRDRSTTATCGASSRPVWQ